MLWLAMDRVRESAQNAKEASYGLQDLKLEIRNAALLGIAELLTLRTDDISEANQKDLEEAARTGLAAPLLKRLKYDGSKVLESVQQMRSLAELEDPLGKLLSRTEVDAGLILDKVSCPIGVIAVVFESRPDALVQISSLCLKSGNACLLKGGSEAKRTNQILAETIQEAIITVDRRFEHAVQLLASREEFRSLLEMDDLVDLVIPRGSNELVVSIKASTKIPVLGHAAGICHTYVHEDADLEMAVKVCFDAKCQYPAVCNAMETLLVHRKVAKEFLPRMAGSYRQAGVELRGDSATQAIIKVDTAQDEDWSTEYNDLILSIKLVDSLEEAIDHINRYGSHHTDAIITSSDASASRFMDRVDSASVMRNCSTRFADGYRYGLGAEVGISTNKTHARGPVGLEGLTIYKYRLSGQGQVVADYVGPNAKPFIHRKLA